MSSTSRRASATRAAAARKLAEQQAARRRRTARLITAGVVALLIVAAGIGYLIYSNNSKAPTTYASPTGGTKTSVVVGQASAPITVDIYLDFQCPVCKAFESESGPTLDAMVSAGTVKIAYHPVAYLDRFSSGTKYSTRSSAASGCASDAGVFPAFLTLLYANQPAENATGLTNDQLVSYGKQAGATSSTFATCVTDQKYADWTAALTDKASSDGVTGTPTVLVNGKTVGDGSSAPTLDQLNAAISAAS